MNRNESDDRNEQNDDKSIKKPTKDSTALTPEGSNEKTKTTEGLDKKSSDQRKPQFRLKENTKRRFS
jgi:hypothetical protein